MFNLRQIIRQLSIGLLILSFSLNSQAVLLDEASTSQMTSTASDELNLFAEDTPPEYEDEQTPVEDSVDAPTPEFPERQTDPESNPDASTTDEFNFELENEGPIVDQYSSYSRANGTFNKSELQVGKRYFVRTDRLNLRKSTKLDYTSIIGSLHTNDLVEILDLLDDKTPLVRVRVIQADPTTLVDVEGFSSGEFLSLKPHVSGVAASKYVVIQNVATERLRVYEKCLDSVDCPHRMVFETEMVVGRPEGPAEEPTKFLTWLGRYEVRNWIKFYQDAAVHYPSWYDPNYPRMPKPGSTQAWMDKKYLPNPGEGTYRGAFGWFAGIVGPNANSQWIHGTWGWGSDGNKFIKLTRSFFANVFGDPRSSGCTRLENGAVAYLRDLVPVGTELVRVYAVEGYKDASRKRYNSQSTPIRWDYILTKEGVRKPAPTISKQVVLESGIEKSEWLEQGAYYADQYPDAMKLDRNPSWNDRISGKSGNSYGIPNAEFRGVFLVDEGKFIDYRHPASLKVGGFERRALPEHLKTEGNFVLPGKKKRR